MMIFVMNEQLLCAVIEGWLLVETYTVDLSLSLSENTL
jgi:hypothetical protein